MKNIGVSNWGINHIEELNDKGYPLPSANQIEIHPWSQKPELVQYLKENDIELDNEISEEVIGFGEVLPKGEYVLAQDILNKEEEELSAKKGDKVIAYEDESPVDTVLGVEIFPVIHVKSQEKIYISLEDIKDDS